MGEAACAWTASLLSGSRAGRRLALIAIAALAGLAAALAIQPGVAGRAPAPASGGLAGVPLAAQGPISQLLGRERPSYAVRGLRAVNAPERLTLGFSRRRVTITSGAARLGIALSAYGYAGALRPVAPVAPVASSNRVSYQHGSLTAWYANGPLGLEQGFTLDSRPRGPRGDLTFSLSLSGGLGARLQGGSVLLRGRGAALRYGGLVASDARGHTLPASLALAGGRILIRVDDRHATYPVRIDPFVQQAELTSSGSVDEGFGYSVAISGPTVVVGDPYGGTSDAGAAYVFAEPGAGWASATETKKLTALDGVAGDNFGYSVAVAGTTIAVGAPFHKSGAVYVFTAPSASDWAAAAQNAELTATDSVFLGSSVAISSTGNTIVGGDPGANDNQGAAYVFTEPASGGWATTSSYAADLHMLSVLSGCPQFGSSVAISSSGSTVVVGAPGVDDGHAPCNVSLNGSAYAFVEGSSWGTGAGLAPTATLTPSGSAAGDLFGASVAISGDGDTILAGSPGQGAGQGAAYVFVDGAQAAELTPTDGTTDDAFGTSVAISSDGSTAVIAEPDSQAVQSRDSAAYVFTEPSAGWSGALGSPTELSPALSGAPAGGLPVYRVAVSGGTILAGVFNTGAFVFQTPLGIGISAPANGATYTQGQVVDAEYVCVAPSGTTVTSCNGPVAGGAAIDTSTLGSHNFTVNATDSAGTTASETVSYTVAAATSKTTTSTTTSTTSTTETPAQIAAQEQAADAAFAAWFQLLLDSPGNDTIAGTLGDPGGIPVSYTPVPASGVIKTGGTTTSSTFPSAADVASAARGRRAVVVFKSSTVIRKPGKVSFKIPLTRAGRKLLKLALKQHRSLTINWVVTYTPHGRPVIRRTFKITLKPGHPPKKHARK